jgi:hypothetical protein
MAIVGFNFTKILLERGEKFSGNLSIKNNVAVKSVDEKDFNVGKSTQKGIVFKVEYTAKYEPDAATISIAGEVLFLTEPKKIKTIVSGWKDGQKIEPELMQQVLNAALNKCNIKALILSQDLNLPPPIPLPRVNVEKKDKSSSKKSDDKKQSYIG